MISCIMAAIQSSIIGVCIDSRKEVWRLEWNLQLITILYSGAIATAATFCLLSWAITIKGPTYPPMFNPLALVFVAISAAIILGEPLKVGTLIGMVLIILGLYFFLWGKKNEIPRLPQTNVAAGELSTSITTDDSFQAQSTAVVGPSSSPDKTVLVEIDKTDKK
ncbi:auxin-induced protein 5ng4-like [Trifolium pratense]|uniref:WAT1-related protein n=1 Tax=Trifolium pratense TaxID=57577 RepID=A0A2K3LY15_TRIPR|nr:auxin-induced protein 5ng4-like [Trifolium pratense]